jgi:hypothetical protein
MLPNELLRSIAAYLDWESARKLSLVNKQSYNVALSRVYKSFRCDYPLKFPRTVALPAPHGQPAMTKQVKHVKWEPDYSRDVLGTDPEIDEGVTTSPTSNPWKSMVSPNGIIVAIGSDISPPTRVASTSVNDHIYKIHSSQVIVHWNPTVVSARP